MTQHSIYIIAAVAAGVVTPAAASEGIAVDTAFSRLDSQNTSERRTICLHADKINDHLDSALDRRDHGVRG